MKQKFKCPMMYGMYNMMQEPGLMGMPHCMPMTNDVELECLYGDEEDERQFIKLYPDSCRHMMIYVKVEIDIMEEKDKMLLEDRPDMRTIDLMTDSAYKKLIRENPEWEELGETRQYPAGRFTRDLLRVLLLNELLRRRRRRRRRVFYGYPFYDNDYFDNDYNDYD